MRRFWILMVCGLTFSACGGEEAETSEGNSETDALNVQTTIEKESDSQTNEVEIKLYTVGEDMTTMSFEPMRIEVPPGSTVNLTLMNKAKSEAMIHNAVFIESGSQTEVLEAALEAGPDKEYVPESTKIFAYTKLAKPGETVELTFTAPENKGTYQYICTYPGHSSMKGILIVR